MDITNTDTHRQRILPSVQAEPELSVIVAASDVKGLAAMLRSYRPALDGLQRRYEVICMNDGAEAHTLAELRPLEADWPELSVVAQRPWAGDDFALLAAIRRARGALVLTLSAWPEVATLELGRLFAALGDNDMVVAARRQCGKQTAFQGLRKRLLHRLLTALSGQDFSDPFCRVRLARREVIAEAAAFGSRQHFIPVVAAERGYRVVELELSPPEQGHENVRYFFKPLGHLRALLDGMTLFVVLKFLRRPMRFFGAIGLPLFLIGSIATLVLVAFRLFGDMALADRPALIFFVLMIVLGVQIIAIGLVGEIMIFANARRIKQYTVRNLIQNGEARAPTAVEGTLPEADRVLNTPGKETVNP
ncbi:glycosyltransferase [Sulfitobacter aestuarii]|uniref:Glycosyltransferase n=1 Tax=Sulfitobacter aestuarii TaxID=2161676 RepID=A0ABW5U2J1_9RHOB